MISENIIVAIIGGGALIVAALIEKTKKKTTNKTITIKQKINERNSEAIGIQNNYGKNED